VSATAALSSEKTQKRSQRDDVSLGVAATQGFDGAKKRLPHHGHIVLRRSVANRWKHLLDEPLVAINRSGLDAALAVHPGTKPNQRGRQRSRRSRRPRCRDTEPYEVLGKLPYPPRNAPRRALPVLAYAGTFALVTGEPGDGRFVEPADPGVPGVHPSAQMCGRSHEVAGRKYSVASRDQFGGKARKIRLDAAARSDACQNRFQLNLLHGYLLSPPSWWRL
jgi:hypothetical protein